MITAVAFVLAAALGSVARAEAARRWNRREGLAAGTLVVNVTGSFLLGLLSERTGPAVTVVGVGALGAFTTFSSFARDIVAAVELRRLVLAAGYTAVTLTAGILAAAIGSTMV